MNDIQVEMDNRSGTSWDPLGPVGTSWDRKGSNEMGLKPLLTFWWSIHPRLVSGSTWISSGNKRNRLMCENELESDKWPPRLGANCNRQLRHSTVFFSAFLFPVARIEFEPLFRTFTRSIHFHRIHFHRDVIQQLNPSRPFTPFKSPTQFTQLQHSNHFII